MRELQTSDDMRALEELAVESLQVTRQELTERAGQAVCDAIFERWPNFAATSFRALVLCGPGNNGADGFVVARLLQQRGWEVSVIIYGDPARDFGSNTQIAYDAWCSVGTEQSAEKEADPATYDLAIDAIFGAGFHGDLDFIPVVCRGRRIGARYAPLVSIDMPSGIDMDTGATGGKGFATYADLTVTFHRPKLGHYLGYGSVFCGESVVKDIGLTPWDPLDEPDLTNCFLIGAPENIAKSEDKEHKFSYGHALVLAGPQGKGGAGRLAARGALRIGAGVVTLLCPSKALAENAAHLNAIMLETCETAKDLILLMADDRVKAVCLGPGLGVNDSTRDLVKAALKTGRPLVLDADALTAFQPKPQILFKLLHPKVCLTPHMGEFASLFPDLARWMKEDDPDLATDKVSAVKHAAANVGCTILLKGADTVIADDQRLTALNAAVYDRAVPWLATAGAGDVLAGFITGLMARGWSPFEAAKAAAWLHVECARSFGPGLIAEDLSDELPKVLRNLPNSL
ncbi:UNVERIFIED_CONTAM: hypothetical protein GTU68_055370 [Idotea baltica]|nr:hypothetical protein [Idotea baltica]